MNNFDLIVQRLDPRAPSLPLPSEPLILAQGINPDLRRRHIDEVRYESRQVGTQPIVYKPAR